MDFEELHAKGWAEVIMERPCPKIASGPGRVVTATITHANDDVRTLTMSSGEVLHVTGNHRMFSATRQDWVPVKDLSVGEALRTVKGRESVASLGFQRGRHQVYNIEVETEHCYFVGNGEVLTHNTCGPDGAPLALTHSDKTNDANNSGATSEGRKGDQARLRELGNDDKVSSADRGWIKQEMNSIEQGKQEKIRRPPGKELAHERGREAAKGYSYQHSNLQEKGLHTLQHKHDDFGRKNKERPVTRKTGKRR